MRCFIGVALVYELRQSSGTGTRHHVSSTQKMYAFGSQDYGSRETDKLYT